MRTNKPPDFARAADPMAQSASTGTRLDDPERVQAMGTDTAISKMGVNTNVNPASSVSPWLTVKEAAVRARCGVKLMYREVEAKRLKAARVGGRRELRILPEWVDQWLLAQTTIQSA
jgi:excisionase family DNA binding protein